jgi:ATP-binding cassette subfamily B protein/subfamily B ATP-binding cassette protein MsbA
MTVRELSWTLSWLRPYRLRLAAISILAAAEIGLGALAPWPFKAVVDNVLAGQPLPPAVAAIVHPLIGTSSIVLLVAIVVAGLVLQIAAELVLMLHTQMQVDMGQGIVCDLRAKLLAHIQALPLGVHVRSRTADSVYRLDADAYCVNDLVMGGVFPLSMAVLKLSVMFLILVRLDAALALLALAVIPCLFACLRYYSTRMIDRAERVKALESTLLERAYETVSSIAAVKSFAREAYELARFRRAGAETMRARLKLTWQESLFSVAVTGVTLGGTALVVTVGAMHVLAGDLTVGGLLVVVAYLAAVYNPLSAIAHTTGSLQQAIVSARRVREIFALTPEIPEAPGALDASGIAGHVRFEDVSFAHDDDRPIVQAVSFAARPGEMVALVGLTGAGKTTLASLIPRFYEPTRGRILIDGTDIVRYGLRSLRERIALVPQEPILFSGTIADNIRYGRLEASQGEVEEAARAAQAHAFIVRLPKGYDTPVDEAGATLSAGERQRLAIARALVKNAPILILDEPTSALDAISEEAVFEGLRRLPHLCTTIVIAHRLSTIRDASRILVLHEGRVVAEGRHDDLVKSNDLYQRMCARLAVGRSIDELEPDDSLVRALS